MNEFNAALMVAAASFAWAVLSTGLWLHGRRVVYAQRKTTGWVTHLQLPEMAYCADKAGPIAFGDRPPGLYLPAEQCAAHAEALAAAMERLPVLDRMALMSLMDSLLCVDAEGVR